MGKIGTPLFLYSTLSTLKMSRFVRKKKFKILFMSARVTLSVLLRKVAKKSLSAFWKTTLAKI